MITVLLLLFTALGRAAPQGRGAGAVVGRAPPWKGVSTYRFWVRADTVRGVVRVMGESKAAREGGRWRRGGGGSPNIVWGGGGASGGRRGAG